MSTFIKEKVIFVSEVNRQGRELNLLERSINFIRQKVFAFELKHEQARSILFLGLGVIYSVIIYALTVYQVEELDSKTKSILFYVIAFIVTLGMGHIKRSRCLLTLIVFNFLTSSGKVLISSQILIHTLDAPTRNIFDNLNEIGQSFKCQFGMDESMLKTPQPIIKIQHAMNKIMNKKRDYLNRLQQNLYKIVTPMITELEVNKSEATTDQAYFDSKMADCIKMINNFKETCDNMSEIMLNNCSEASWKCFGIKVFDKYIHQLTPTCQRIVSDNTTMSTICSRYMIRANSIGLDGMVDNLKHLKEALSGEIGPIPPNNLDIRRFNKLLNKKTVSKLQTDFEYVRGVIKMLRENLSGLVKAISLIANYNFTFIILSSFLYHSNYLRDASFDNKCITQYFRHVDARRYLSGKRTVMPLRKLERKELHYPFQLIVPNSQRLIMKLNLAINVSLLAFFLCTLAVDRLVVDFMHMFVTKTDILQYEESSKDDVQTSVSGDGLLADAIRQLENEIESNKQKGLERKVLRSCKSKVYEMSTSQVYLLYRLIGLLLLASLMEIYFKRFSRSICSMFYRCREKKRIIWLYNRCMCKRLDMIRTAKKKLAIKKHKGQLAKRENQLSQYLRSRFDSSRICLLALKIVGLVSKRYCVLCDQIEQATSLQCQTCSLIYCMECWLDLDEKCVSCASNFILENLWEFDFDQE